MPVRPASLPADLPIIRALLQSAADRDGFPPLSEEARVALDSGSGPAGWMAVEGGEARGFAHARRHRGETVVELVTGAPSAAVVPSLVAAIRAADQQSAARVWVTDSDAAAAVRDAGGAPSRSLVRLQRELPAEPPEPPGEARIVPFRRGADEEAYLLVANDAFSGHPESSGWTRETFEARAARPWFDPHGIFLAWMRGVPVGAVWTKQHGGGVGEIYSIAVRPRAAGRGLGRSLVLAGFADLAGRCGASIGMLWADEANTAAGRLYRGLGMEPVRRRIELLVG